MIWRAMQEDDLAAVQVIAQVVHPAYPESPQVFAERLQLFAAGCRVAVAADMPQLVHGYAITHPAMLGQPPALDTLLHQLPPHADCLYLHDVALMATTRQSGLGSQLVALIRQQAQTLQLAHAALVAVNRSADYWRRRGFMLWERADARLLTKIASYDADAQYLVLPVALTETRRPASL